MKSWTVQVEYDHQSGDFVLPLSDEMLQGLDWKTGDVLVWTDLKDGSWSLSKKRTVLTRIKEYYILLKNKFIKE